MSTFVIENFTNEIEQVIVPGDEVLYIGTSWKNTRASLATYEGVYKNESGDILAVRVGGIDADKFVWEKDKPFNPELGHYRPSYYDPIDDTRPKFYYEPYFRKAVLPLKRIYKIEQKTTVRVQRNNLNDVKVSLFNKFFRMK